MDKRIAFPHRAATAAFLAVSFATFTGCGSSNSSTNQAQSSAGASSAAPASAAGPASAASPATEAPAAAGQGADASTDLPIYPGATKIALRSHADVTTCGHKMTLVMYDVAADARTVTDWYKTRMSGAIVIDVNGAEAADGGSSEGTNMELMGSNGAQGVVISQIRFTNSKLAAAAKSIDADKTNIGFETYDPPLGQDYLQLMAAGTSGNPAAMQAARTKLEAMCPNN